MTDDCSVGDVSRALSVSTTQLQSSSRNSGKDDSSFERKIGAKENRAVLWSKLAFLIVLMSAAAISCYFTWRFTEERNKNEFIAEVRVYGGGIECRF